MSIKDFMFSFMISSLFFSLLFIPTLVTRPINSTKFFQIISSNNISQSLNTYPVKFAYLISASKGDLNRLKRALVALYHPNNYYLLHMDQSAPKTEHQSLAKYVSSDPVFTQVDLIHAFSDLPRDLNFVQHSGHLGWKLSKRGKPIIIDPGLYNINKSEIWWVIKQRALPTAFKLYTGSAWTILSRSFTEYCIWGYDNLPRTLLLYYTNFVSSPEGYFQTLICNSEDYKNTTVNHDFHYITWDIPPKQHPRPLGLKDYRRMVLSNAPFARKFKQNDPVLAKVDHELLRRRKGKFAYGGWCSKSGGEDGACSRLSDDLGVLKPGPGSRRLKALLTKMLSERNFRRRQCR
ncbi:hypothetical protein Sjap_013031 [Stephania japonica]|uniref:Uncharacterized protein n=1 Tax=Stephania japonica TaxID=461633 RepID=A0AAP0NYT4_9MAGN